MDADDKLFRFDQNWVHQNPGTHLDGSIEEDGKWQQRWKIIILLPTQHYDLPPEWVGKQFFANLVVDLDRISN